MTKTTGEKTMREEKVEKVVMETGMVCGLAIKPYSIAQEIKWFLNSVKDEGTAIDTGAYADEAGVWVTVEGVEYYININIQPSAKQLAKERQGE